MAILLILELTGQNTYLKENDSISKVMMRVEISNHAHWHLVDLNTDY